jgi:beta-lactamase class D
VWFFRRTAAAIGADRMKEWLSTLQYGSDSFDGDPTYFWLNGDLVVSPREQLDFLIRMFRYQIPVQRPIIDIVSTAMTMPPGKISNAAGLHDFPLTWGADATVRAKTGNTRVGDERVSWLVGRIRSPTSDYVFVSRIRADHELSTTAGADVALQHLNRLR